MNCLCFKRNLTVFAAIATLLLGASIHCTAEDATNTISGRVVDVDGNLIAGMLIAVQSIEIWDDEVYPKYLFEEDELIVLKEYIALPKSKTDKAGQFSFTGIKPGPIQFVAQPPQLPADLKLPPDFDVDIFAPDTEILSIEIGAITFYPFNEDLPPPFGGITFAIEPGIHLENVVVTVRPRMRIRGQIVFADGTPLANAEVELNVRRRDFDGSGTGRSGSAPRTDDAGYFVKYVDEPGLYTVAVEFQGLSTMSEQFILETGQRHDSLVLKFDSGPIPVDPAPDQVERESAGTWVLNPANRHSYKRVYCESWEEAQAKAVTENAHLVSINDAAEQKWLVGIFGGGPYWIGLTDVAKEGEWRWTSGEPVTYTNWVSDKPKSANLDTEDYVFMWLSPKGEWRSVGPKSPEWRMTRMAILEQDSAPAKTPAKKK